jgi:hypothetical protein
MKKLVPFIIAAIVIVGVYFLWKTYGTSSLTGKISGLQGSDATSSTPPEKQADWQTVDQSAAGFKLKMPSEPRQVVVQALNESGSTEPVRMLVTSGDAQTTYAVAWADNPPVARVNADIADKTLDQARDGAMARTQTTLISENRVNPQGFPGREFVARNVGGGYLETRFVVAGSRLYMLIAASPSIAVRHDQEIARFFNSFALSSDQKVPESVPAATRQ